MHSHFVLLFSLLAASTIVALPLPLNINLGAYSPALVVGDGEISFGGKQDVTNLMNALEGAAVSGAAANGAAAPTVTTPTPAQAQSATQAEVAPVTVIPDQQTQEAAQIASLQGMGKEIAPRVVSMEEVGAEVEKRDISGFNAALKYATGALTTSPKVQLGTGAEGSGVGILQDAGGNRPAAAAAKRDGISERGGVAPKTRTTVTTMFVRGGPAPAVRERSLAEAPGSKRAPSAGVDGVSLNVADGQVAELTFVETRGPGDEDEG
ncbi:hypothetical protein LOCC1_G001945 [Lachnellula occidentalis]|uniref:Uncharacterized protein n=1 Tax=Lachnellula occidentalis TaxID=215460 RepID=A0A8H8S6R8_9HELO|nr:hypothetical protein LOCC1_G001945 [Lachnellula occidentalis]